MTTPLAFPCRSPLARRRFSKVPLAELIDSVAADLDRRRTTYPALVGRGRLSQADADHRIDTWAAILDDLRRTRALLPGAPTDEVAPWSGSWADRVGEIRRELEARRATYPGLIAKDTHPLTAEEAARIFDQLDALYHRYWVDLVNFSGPDVRPADDHARIAWIAETELQALRLGGDLLDAATTPDAAPWRAILRHVGWQRDGDPHRQQPAGELGRLLEWSWRRCEDLVLRTIEDPQLERAYVWTLHVDAWLQRRRVIAG